MRRSTGPAINHAGTARADPGTRASPPSVGATEKSTADRTSPSADHWKRGDTRRPATTRPSSPRNTNGTAPMRPEGRNRTWSRRCCATSDASRVAGWRIGSPPGTDRSIGRPKRGLWRESTRTGSALVHRLEKSTQLCAGPSGPPAASSRRASAYRGQMSRVRASIRSASPETSSDPAEEPLWT